MFDRGTMQTARRDVVSIFASLPEQIRIEVVPTLANEIVPQQLCTGLCGAVKPLTEFATDKRIKSGRSRRCYECVNAHRRANYTNHPERRVWLNMIARCEHTQHDAFERYGGRGIAVYGPWHSFDAFLADVGRRPSPQHTLERIDNNGNYEPGNVKWATNKEQNRNRGDYNNRITAFGLTLTISEWAERLQTNHQTIHRRINIHGWSPEDAVSVPVRQMRPRKVSA